MTRGVNVSEVGWEAAIREALARRGDADERLLRDGQVIFISLSTEGDTDEQKAQTSTDIRS
jgi:hypothetical protein